jgi:folate-dependent tRNA-U54 methylase TrmFO/GidA
MMNRLVSGVSEHIVDPLLDAGQVGRMASAQHGLQVAVLEMKGWHNARFIRLYILHRGAHIDELLPRQLRALLRRRRGRRLRAAEAAVVAGHQRSLAFEGHERAGFTYSSAHVFSSSTERVQVEMFL